jgi:vacuolar-type H+-ATPase subunit E/Vma4
VASVAAAIADDVEAEVEAIRRRTEAARAARRAQEAAEPASLPDREVRLMAARQEARERLARADWEAAREALQDRERWMEAVAESGLRRLGERAATPAERARELRALLAEALSALPGAAFDVLVSPRDAAALSADEAGLSALAPGITLRVVADDAVDGGCRAQAADGRACVDNTHAARARRLAPEWRAALGEVYGR